MLDLNAMALFAKVVEHKSFSEASKRLGVPISTVSRKVGQLEKDLGVRLLERSTRRHRLTDVGQHYYEYCRRALEEFEAGTSMINERQAEVSGTLRLSIAPSLADALAVPLIAAFQAVHPKAVVRLWVTDRKVDLIEDGVDLALRVGELADSSLAARELLRYRHLLVASPGYIAAAGMPKRPQDLQNQRLIAFANLHRNVVWHLAKHQNTARIPLDGTMTLNDYAGVRRAVEMNLGIAEFPSILCAEAIANGTMVEVLPGWQFAPTKLSAVYSGDRNAPRLVRLFKDFCIAHIADVVSHTRV